MGYPAYQSGNWYGVMVPAKTPKETIAAIRDAIIATLNNPNLNKRLTDLSFVAIGDTSEEFAVHIKTEIAALAKIVTAFNLSAGY